MNAIKKNEKLRMEKELIVARLSLCVTINAKLETLSALERETLRLKYGLHNGICCTIKDISAQCGVDVQTIQYARACAFTKLRHPDHSKPIRMAAHSWMHKMLYFPDKVRIDLPELRYLQLCADILGEQQQMRACLKKKLR